MRRIGVILAPILQTISSNPRHPSIRGVTGGCRPVCLAWARHGAARHRSAGLYRCVCPPSRAAGPDSELCENVQRPQHRRLPRHLWSYTSSLTPASQPTCLPSPSPGLDLCLCVCVLVLVLVRACVRACVRAGGVPYCFSTGDCIHAWCLWEV